MKPKLLYIGEKVVNVSGGAQVINKRNQTLLEANFSVSYIPLGHGFMAKPFLSVTNQCLLSIDEQLQDNAVEYVFVQQSLLGRACRYIKEKYPDLRIIVFFHNIEAQYAKEYLKTIGIKALPFYFAVCYWEKMGIKFADYCITLNSRDSGLLNSIYHRDSDLELSTSFSDNFNEDKRLACAKNYEDRIDYLFVGVAFFANVEAIQWFIDKVMPNVDGTLYIVGKGMDHVAFKNMASNIHVYGYVDDLSEYYYRARLVVSPIRVGGGMKTKTAEALMYGKTILGSPEAFEGYEIDDRCMILCESAKDYIAYIQCNKKGITTYNAAARLLYKQKYSDEVASEKLRTFIKGNLLA